jgi:hypothetical protein
MTPAYANPYGMVGTHHISPAKARRNPRLSDPPRSPMLEPASQNATSTSTRPAAPRPAGRSPTCCCATSAAGTPRIVTRLGRARSVLHLVTLGAALPERGVEPRVLEQGIDTPTAEGRARFGTLSMLAELQRELTVANTRDGLPRAAPAAGPAADDPSFSATPRSTATTS